MRLRHIPEAETYLAHDDDYAVVNVTKSTDLYQQWFGYTPKPIWLEIGVGKCGFIYQQALKHPNINFIGVERYAAPLYLGVKKIKRLSAHKLPNLKLLLINAYELDTILPPNSISKIYLNFSDPWPKKRHHKRRLTSAKIIALYASWLTPTGTIELKTDNLDLFNDSKANFIRAQWHVIADSKDLYNSPYLSNNVATEYETRFVQQHKPIYFLQVSPCGEHKQ